MLIFTTCHKRDNRHNISVYRCNNYIQNAVFKYPSETIQASIGIVKAAGTKPSHEGYFEGL